ncbi:MAG TPA: bifunctional [glutamine synthetase] adenylyltransferase/[glutamine synthetase]-adenylyl-L-tyrosine phosphorylase [Afifellaceae bacterium]|nr:bifunctional [glutamine synthetase] adenylyltransferase/[glutamine synthetase]-adenylyl-L-tyrosine phosphorylase [Afifellaceae bacterium]
MARAVLAERITPLPQSPDGARALAELIEAASRDGSAGTLEKLAASETVGGFLASVLGDCPFLFDLSMKQPARLASILQSVPEDLVRQVISDIETARWETRTDAMSALRQARQTVALALGLADLAGAVELETVTSGLTDFADAAVNAALRHALQDAERQGKWDGTALEKSGLVIIGMGKYGADELNYSSDIDIIAFYDPRAPGLTDGQEPSVFWVRVIRLLVQLLQERTADGYVFRTDLRLRPDPGATPVAISLDGALQYYESMGQNWERAALIKARACAGNIATGQTFLQEIGPFIWRRYLDFAAIADIHSIKRQIHAHKGHGTVRVGGHDLKRGRGGIREIEFFVQTQQLIAGGRDTELRGQGTREMLRKLCEHRWIDEEARDELDEAYVWFRRLEHRLQMVRDEQTQIIPEDREELARIGRLCGFSVVSGFEDEARRRLNAVAARYAALFEDEPTLSGEAGNLVFTGDDDDPETLATLDRMGFADPAYVTRTIRAWHFGRFAAMRSTAARQNLTSITPALLKAFAEAGDGDAAVRTFDAILRGLPAGVQLFALLAARRELLDLLAMILAAAPRLAEAFARRPQIVGSLIDPAVFDADTDRDALSERLEESLGQASAFEEVLDRVRLFASEQRFLLSIRLLTGAMKPAEIGIALSDLAEVVAAALLREVQSEFAAHHGRVAGGRIALVAMGRLGSREMTAGSDLDLIVIYDHEKDADASDGAKPLPPSQYFTRLTQRLVAALSAPTAEGIAYEVDLRLRPSGRSGPLATHIEAFDRYQNEEAWTWEHLALSRARTVAGDESLRETVDGIVAKVVSRERDLRKLKDDLLEMRGKVQAERGTVDRWSFKTVAGGLMDVEFAAQFAVLAGLERKPGEPTAETLRRAAEDPDLGGDDWLELVEAAEFQGALMQYVRVANDRPFRPEDAPASLGRFLARQLKEPDVSVLSARLGDIQDMAEMAFFRVLEKVAEGVEAT